MEHGQLSHDLANPHSWIQRCLGVLEDGLNPRAIVRDLSPRVGLQCLTVESDFASCGNLQHQDELRER